MKKQEFETAYMSHLNVQQREAVESVNGAVLLLAVPGSGKTTVLVTRLGYMVLCCGIAPENILTMTYTVAATKEMKQRFARLFGDEYAERMEFRTINGVSSRIIARYSRYYSGREPFALEEDEGRLTLIVKKIYSGFYSEYPDESTIKNIRSYITYAKNMQLTKAELEELDTGVKHFPEIYEQYNRTLVDLRIMDYDDQMRYALSMLKRYPELLEDFRARYRYICVDESQDTSKIQHEIIKLLAGENGNIFMVGDEDQSIYGFRAAYPEALINFEKEYRGAKVLLMEQNYRSTPEIIAAADAFIEKNLSRHPKHMRGDNPSGKPVTEIPVTSRQAQYNYIYKLAENCTRETAVLYRNNDSALPLIDLFERSGIPYNCRRYDDSFFNHRIIADIRDIAALSKNRCDEEAFMRVYYKLGCPIKKSAAQYACVKNRESGNGLFEELYDAPELSEFGRECVKELIGNLRLLEIDSAERAVRRILNRMNYAQFVERNKLDTGKLDILSQLARSETSIYSLLQRLETLRSLIAVHENSRSVKLTLSTLHSCKGLEFERVYLMDVYDGVLPSIRKADAKTAAEKKQYEEERRLFYVGMTRAKKELYIFNGHEHSSFAEEVFKAHEAEKTEQLRTVKNEISLRPAQKHEPIQLSAGDRVQHISYGDGTIISIDEKDNCIIQFDTEEKPKHMVMSVIAKNGIVRKI